MKKVLMLILVTSFIFFGCSTKDKKVENKEPQKKIFMKEESKFPLEEDLVNFITQMNLISYIGKDVSLKVVLDDNYWQSKNSKGITRREDFINFNILDIKRTYTLLIYANDNNIELSNKENIDIRNQAEQFLEDNGSFTNKFFKQSKFSPKIEEVEAYMKSIKLAERSLGKMSDSMKDKTDITKAVGVYEIKIPVKYAQENDTDKSLKVSRKIAKQVYDKLKSDKGLLEVAKEYGVEAYPREYTDMDKFDTNFATQLEKLFKMNKNDITEAFELKKNGDIQAFIINKVVESNTKAYLKTIQDKQKSKAKRELVDQLLTKSMEKIQVNKKFFDEIKLPMNKNLIKLFTNKE